MQWRENDKQNGGKRRTQWRKNDEGKGGKMRMQWWENDKRNVAEKDKRNGRKVTNAIAGKWQT